MTAAELRIPPDGAYASLVAAFVRDTAARAALAEPDIEGITAAAQTACELIVREAMADSHEALRLVARESAESFRVSIFERGLPIDDTMMLRDAHWAGVVQRVERASWRLRGRLGSELRLEMHRPHGIAHDGAKPVDPESVPLAPEQEYTLRPFVPADAPGIARAFYQTWGYHYVYPPVYVPERLIAVNQSGEYISLVAVAQDGEIVGHYALDALPETPIADLCSAIVVPAHRGRGLLDKMRRFAGEEAARRGFAAYYSEPVTLHGRTQSESIKVGAKLCALVLATDPPAFVPKAMTVTGAGQRQSVTVYMKPLEQRDSRVVYAPPHHREMVAAIYSNLGLPVEFAAAGIPQGDSELHVSVNRSEGFASVDVLHAGPECAGKLAQLFSDLREMTHAGAVYVNLPLEQPGTPSLCDALERIGFFFCGVIPWALQGGDALRLQRPLTRIDMAGLTVVGEFGVQLKDYVAAHYARAAAPV